MFLPLYRFVQNKRERERERERKRERDYIFIFLKNTYILKRYKLSLNAVFNPLNIVLSLEKECFC